MTKADEMRRLLDEHKVEYTQALAAEGTLFIVTINKKYYFILVRDNDEGLEIWSKYITPEQAIDATLGRGECHDVGDPSDFCCSECGIRMFTNTNDTYTMIDSLGNIIEQPSFCPNCGMKVVDE